MIRFLLILCFAAATSWAADTIAILPLANMDSSAPNLNWIGESAAENLHEALSAQGLLVLSREDRVEAYHRMAARAGAVITKATVVKIGQMLDAGQILYGEYKVDSAPGGSPGPQSNMRISVHIIDLKRFRDGGEFEQTGPLSSLSQMEVKLAWQVMHQLSPLSTPSQDAFMRDYPPIRVEAMENYVRAFTAAPDEKVRLFTVAARLDERFSQPNYQLGRINFDKKDYKAAPVWLSKVSKSDSHALEASYLLGICRYHEGDFETAVKQFNMVAEQMPLNEVFNNLGAAYSRRNDAAAIGNFKKALDGDEGDPDYWFNYGYSLWKLGQYPQAADQFREVLKRSPEDQEATSMLGRALANDGFRAGDPRTDGRERIKTEFEDSAFRQLQAEIRK